MFTVFNSILFDGLNKYGKKIHSNQAENSEYHRITCRKKLKAIPSSTLSPLASTKQANFNMNRDERKTRRRNFLFVCARVSVEKANQVCWLAYFSNISSSVCLCVRCDRFGLGYFDGTNETVFGCDITCSIRTHRVYRSASSFTTASFLECIG